MDSKLVGFYFLLDEKVDPSRGGNRCGIYDITAPRNVLEWISGRNKLLLFKISCFLEGNSKQKVVIACHRA